VPRRLAGNYYYVEVQLLKYLVLSTAVILSFSCNVVSGTDERYEWEWRTEERLVEDYCSKVLKGADECAKENIPF
jgi:hypothetical protein